MRAAEVMALVISILNNLDFTGEGDEPADDVNNTKDPRSLDIVGIFQVLVLLLLGGLGEVDNLCVWDVLLLHFEVSL